MNSYEHFLDRVHTTDDPLKDFLDYLSAKLPSPIGWIPLTDAVHYVEGVTSITWFRQGQFQAQMFVVPPNHVIPEHTHPNVDSYEVYVGGQVRFSKNGKWLYPDTNVTIPDRFGLPARRGYITRVKPNDPHGGVFGPSGGVFLSVQHWLNGVKPHCVAADYTGVVMGPDHLSKVKFGDAVLKTALDAKDAAGAESVS